MVTKQQQLEWLAENRESWPYIGPVMIMSDKSIGVHYGAPMPGCHFVNFTEWQQERDKMSSKPEADNAWHERGELPPVGLPVELWVCGTFAYNCEFISKRGNNYVLWNLDSDKADSADYMHSQFRPLRTERERAIDEMSLLAVGCEKYAITQNAAKAVCELLYDSGCRMVKP
jgi:hypothetical protein